MPQPSSLSPEQCRAFLDDGLTRISGAVPSDDVEAMAARIWRTLERQLGAVRDRPETWPDAAQPDLKQMARAGVFAAMLSPGVRGLLDELFGGRGWAPPRLPPTPLGVRFPTRATPWNVPTRRWHLDHAEPHAPWPDCVRMFLCLGAVEPGGGGTFFVSGSHRVVGAIAPDMRARRDRVGSARIVRRLKSESLWLADLCSKGDAEAGRETRFMHEGSQLRGFPLRVDEMTGQAGDILLWHPNLLHASALANRRNAPRLVLSVTIEANREG